MGRADEATLAGLLAQVAASSRYDADEASTILLALTCDAQVADFVRHAAAQALGRLIGVGRADEATLAGWLALARDAQVDVEVRRDAYESLKRLLAG